MDSAQKFFFHLQFLSGWKRGLLVGLCPFSLFFRFTTGIRNLRIHPDSKMGFERLANRNCMECPTPARAFRSTNPLFHFRDICVR
uniref:Uncharacterized protein n=1 Tax=Lactuca sativa TaxID=4236 RepID=A0A9R1UKA0_LACSA|nr:hypothetical protein LSAT_V11C900455860 [Lactuca sativa]